MFKSPHSDVVPAVSLDGKRNFEFFLFFSFGLFFFLLRFPKLNLFFPPSL